MTISIEVKDLIVSLAIVAIVAIVAILGINILDSPDPSPPPTLTRTPTLTATPTPEVQAWCRIDAPADGSVIPYINTAYVSSGGLPEDSMIWLLVYNYDNGLYYPQGQAVTGGASPLYVGLPDDTIGDSFDIVAVLAASDARINLMAWARSTDPGRPLASVRAIAQECDRVKVTRK